MRIAVLNTFGKIVGGVERYLDSSIPLLAEAGHEVHLWHEKATFQSWATRPTIRSAATILPGWSMRRPSAEIGGVTASIADWVPDVICVHSALEPQLEQRILDIAPCIYFAHAFSGTCISGSKMLQGPLRPCYRTLGPACLFHNYQDRCGGLNPVRAVRDYTRNVRQLQNIREYSAVVAFSSHVRAEYARHGVAEGKLKLIPPFTPADDLPNNARSERTIGDPIVIGFAGRLIKEKGTRLLLDSLPLVRRALRKRLEVVIAGDGRELRKLRNRAAMIVEEDQGIEIEFTKWAGRTELDEFYARLDLLVVPSVWPEPFGMVGLEAAARRLPVAAFAVGGIRDWLREGVNGHLAPADPPTVRELSAAIVSCVQDLPHYQSLCRGAADVAAEYSAERHARGLMETLDSVHLQRV